MGEEVDRKFVVADLYELFANEGRMGILKRFVEVMAALDDCSEEEAVAFLLSLRTITDGLKKTPAVLDAEKRRRKEDA